MASQKGKSHGLYFQFERKEPAANSAPRPNVNPGGHISHPICNPPLTFNKVSRRLEDPHTWCHQVPLIFIFGIPPGPESTSETHFQKRVYQNPKTEKDTNRTRFPFSSYPKGPKALFKRCSNNYFVIESSQLGLFAKLPLSYFSALCSIDEPALLLLVEWSISMNYIELSRTSGRD